VTTRLRIGMVCFSSLGGSGTIAVELAHALVARGHQVVVLADAQPDRLHGDTPFVAVEPIRHPLFAESPYSLALASALVRASREHALDLVHLHYGVPHATSALLARHTLGASGPAMVVTLHGSDVTTFGAEAAHGPVIGACLRSLDAITTPSRFLQEAASAAFGVTPAVVPNFVDAEAFHPGAGDPTLADAAFGAPAAGATTLIHVSNFRPVKATRELVSMMQALARGGPGRFRLVAIGDGPERAAVEADARAAGVADAIRFVHPIHDVRALASWVAAADLFILPSEMESFGLAALEALACGVPVIARRVGGVPEVVRDGATGQLVADPAEIAGVVESLAADPAKRGRLGTEAAADVRRRFSTAAVADQYEAVHRRALEIWRGKPGRARRAGGDDA
jgi:N-acetyl-alpha-D-glucosaminyl L-malate synthase BshA